MGLLKLVEDVPGIDYYEYRDIHFYSKYLYRARFDIPAVYFTWGCKTVEEFVEDMESPKYVPLRPHVKTRLRENKDKIAEFILFRNYFKLNKLGAIRIEGDRVGVYSNDLQFLQTINTYIKDVKVDITESILSGFVGIKTFAREPKHKYRVYMKSKRVSTEVVEQLRDTIKRNKKLYPSDAFKFWAFDARPNFAWRNRWCSASYFIDYDDESTLSYIALMHGDLLGKRYKLEKRPEQ